MMNQYQLRTNSPSDAQTLFDIWLEAVKATHHFLSPSDIENIGIQVKEYLATAAFVVAMDSSRNVLGFMGMMRGDLFLS
jgi:putative acetyltransferase